MTIGTSEFLNDKIFNLKRALKPYFDSYKTDSLLALKLSLKEEDRVVVLPLISELSSFIGLKNFISGSNSTVNEEDSDKQKIIHALRASERHLESLLNDPDTLKLFSWNTNEKTDDISEAATRVLVRIGESNFDLALLELTYLWYKYKEQ